MPPNNKCNSKLFSLILSTILLCTPHNKALHHYQEVQEEEEEEEDTEEVEEAMEEDMEEDMEGVEEEEEEDQETAPLQTE